MGNVDAYISKQTKTKAPGPLMKREQFISVHSLFIHYSFQLSYNSNSVCYRDLISFKRDRMMKQIKSSLNIKSIKVIRFFSFIILFNVLFILQKSEYKHDNYINKLKLLYV